MSCQYKSHASFFAGQNRQNMTFFRARPPAEKSFCERRFGASQRKIGLLVPQNPDFLEKIRAPLHCITFRSCRQLYRLDQLVLPVARQTKHLSRPLPVFMVAIARENTFVCVDHLQQARADTSDAKHESEPKCISYTQHSVSNLSILRAPVRREPEKFWGVGTAGRLIF